MLGEVAPLLVPQFDALLVSLLAIAGAFVALGIVTVLHGFTRATIGGLAGVLVKLPYVGEVLASPVNKVVHWMNHEFGAAELALDKTIARYLHSLGQLVHWFGNEIGDLSKLLYTVTTVMLGTAAIDSLNRLTSLLSHELAAVRHRGIVVERRMVGIERKVIAGVEHAVYPRIRSLTHAVDDVIPHDITGLRARTRATLERLDHVWQQVRKLDVLLGTAAITAAVAVALTRLDLNWIRCRNWNRIGRGICGIPASLIEALLAGAIDALVVTDLCDLSYLMVAATEEIRPVLLGFVDVEEALVGCHGNTSPPALDLPPLHLAAVRAPLALTG